MQNHRNSAHYFFRIASIRFLAISFIVPLFSTFLSHAQSYTAKTYREIDGLPSNNVFAINQLENGKLLVVTKNGLSTYDGSNWHTFDYNLNIPLGLHTKIKKDDDGKIWLAGFKNHSLAIGYFSGENWIDHSIPFIDDRTVFQYRLAMDQVSDAQGNYSLIIGMQEYLYTYSSKTSTWQEIELPVSKGSCDIYDVKYYKNDVYIVTDIGLWKIDNNGNISELNFDFPTKFLVRMEIDKVNDCYYLLGKNWVGKVKNEKFKTLVTSFKSVFSFQISASHLYLSEGGELYFGINSMIYYLKKNHKNYEAINVLGKMEAFWHNNIFVDRENNLWLSSNRGLGVINNLSLKFYNHSHGLIEDEVSGVIELPGYRFLIGGNFSLVLKDGKECKVLFKKEKNEQVIYRFSNFIEHKNQIYFTGYQKGVGILTSNEEIEWIAPLPIANRPVNDLFFRGDSLFVVSDNSVFYWNNSTYALQKKYSSFVRRVVTLKSGENWLLTTSGILLISGENKGKKIRGKTNKLENVTDVLEYQNKIYVGTYDGLGEIMNDSIVPVSSESLAIRRPIFELFENSDESMWIGTDFGVYVIDKNKKSLHLTNSNGLIGNEINRNTMFRTSKGEVMIGTVDGLAVYSVSEIPSANANPIPIIFSVKSNKKINLNLNKLNTLEPNENGLEIEFGGITFSSIKELEYRHRLKGLESDWNNLTTKTKTSINYANLKGGEYNFELQVKNGQGVWSNIISSPPINILNPFYRKLWFYIVIGILIKILFYFIYQYVIQKKLLKQKVLLEKQHETINKSIRYAKRIQESILPSKKIIDDLFKENFIINKPKDIVAGDFYWFSQRNDKVFFAVADCTGHGVPGSIVSVVCSNALNYVVNELGFLSAADILNRVRFIVVETFSNEDFDITDGMDIAFCILDTNTKILQFSGAHHSLFRTTEKGKEDITYEIEMEGIALIEYKGDSQPVGQFNFNKPFTEQFIQLKQGDALYMTTDGYFDQFGGQNGKKMLKNRFKEKLSEIAQMPMDRQKSELEWHFEEWKGDEIQIDDVCLIGVKI